MLPVAFGADCNRNGVEDLDEIALNAEVDCDENSIPDDCDLSGSVRFEAPEKIQLDHEPASIGLLEFDGDEHTDLVVADLFAETFALYLGLGDGRFGRHSAIDLGDRPFRMVLAELNGDEREDVVVLTRPQRSDVETVVVLLNQKDGFVRSPDPFSEASGAGFPGDFDGDGDVDIVVFSKERELTMLENDGAGNLSRGLELGVPKNMVRFEPIDYNGDALTDLSFYEGATRTVFVQANRGGGVFEPEVRIDPERRLHAYQFGDLDGDGVLEVVGTDQAGDLYILRREEREFTVVTHGGRTQ